MLILYIATGAFLLGGAIILASIYIPQKSSRRWY